MFITILILSITLLASITGNIFLYFLMTRAVKFSEFFESKINTLEVWMEYFQNEMINLYRNLKNIDTDNMFEKDDYVGFAFKDIIDLIADFNGRINEYNVSNEIIITTNDKIKIVDDSTILADEHNKNIKEYLSDQQQ